jgi:hypothetical protein
VFDVIAALYLGRTPRAMSGKLKVLQRGTGMVLAEHYTPVHQGRLTAGLLATPSPPIAEGPGLSKFVGGSRLSGRARSESKCCSGYRRS